MHKVFLSHSHIDKPFVRLIAEELKLAGLTLWIDEVDLLPGDSLIEKISSGVAESTYVVAFISRDSVASGWVKKEISIALTLGIGEKRVVVLPALLPGFESKALPPSMIDLMYVDFRNPCGFDDAIFLLYRRILPDGQKEFPQLMKVRHVNLNADRAEVLVEAAMQSPSVRDYLIDYLACLVQGPSKSQDCTVRHFAYWGLGEIGGSSVDGLIGNGLRESDNFARLAAENAWRKLRH